MKQIYSKPVTEQIILSIEEGACAGVSGTEPFMPQDGTWNTLNFNF